jgi:phosphoglucomutase
MVQVCVFFLLSSGPGARPSRTENIYKIYAESFKAPAHLEAIVKESQGVVGRTLAGKKGAI